MTKRKMEYHTYNAEGDWLTVNPKNRELVKEYMSYISATDKSNETKEKYLHNLKLFFQWVLNNKENKYFPDIKKRDFMAWLGYLTDDQKLSPSRVRTLRSTVSSFANFCENILGDDEDFPEFKGFRNIVLKIPAPALEKIREKTYLTDEQVDKLVDWLEEKQDWRLCLYIVISFTTGMRKSEVMQLKRSDFTEETLLSNGMYKTSPKRCKGRGRTGKIRNFLIPSDLIDKYLKLYLQTRKDDLDDLFITNYGGIRPVNESTFNSWCDKMTEYLGVPVYPHCYRSSIATILKKRGKDISKIQKLLGHSDISTTNIYIQPDDESDIEDLYN